MLLKSGLLLKPVCCSKAVCCSQTCYGSLSTAAPLCTQDCRPGYLALAAAHLAVARRAALEEAAAAAAHGAGPPPLAWDPGSVRKGPWLGQVVRRSDTGAVMCVGGRNATAAAHVIVLLHMLQVAYPAVVAFCHCRPLHKEGHSFGAAHASLHLLPAPLAER